MAEKLYYTVGELAEMFDVNASLIRYWETQFGVLRPKRNKKGNRLFTTADVESLKLIYHLVRERGMTLDGAKKTLRQQRGEGQGVDREVELMERLQHIRSLLLEVREDLKDEASEAIEIKIDNMAESASQTADMPIKVRPKTQRAVKKQVVADVVVTVVKEAEIQEKMPPEMEIEKSAVQELIMSDSVDCKPIEQPFAESFDLQDNLLEDESDAEFESDCNEGLDNNFEDSLNAGSDIDPQIDPAIPSDKPMVVARRPRRRKEDAENKELFAFYEQSLF